MKWIFTAWLGLYAAQAVGQPRPWPPPDSTVGDTFFSDCAKATARHLVSPLSFSEDGLWRAWAEVDRGSPECLLKSSLWIARVDGPDQLAYFMAPEREAGGDGIQILGWMPGAPVVLVKTERWQWGSDAEDTQQVLAIEASTGRVYEPKLSDILEAHSGKQCSLRLTDAGFAHPGAFEILVRVKLATAHDVDETDADIPAEKRCENVEETWDFNYQSAYEVKQVSNREQLLLFRRPGSTVESLAAPRAGSAH